MDPTALTKLELWRRPVGGGRMGGLCLAQPLLSLAAALPAHQSDLLLLRLVGLKSLGERKSRQSSQKHGAQG